MAVKPDTSGTGGSFEETRQRALVRGLEVSLRERLEWLEEAIEFAHQTGALPRPRDEVGNIRR
ncbi:MAG: hypothetical protein VCC00_12150 [Deltaproteobacteria bacterium]